MKQYSYSKRFYVALLGLAFAIALTLMGGYAADQTALTIMSPVENAAVPAQLTLTGTAPPNSTISVKVFPASSGGRHHHGSPLAEVQATADADGHFNANLDLSSISSGTKLNLVVEQQGTKTRKRIKITRQ